MWGSDIRLYLVPSVALMALVAALPLVVEARRRDRFDAYNPIVFVSWMHVLPSFVVGGAALVNGWTPWIFQLIPVPDVTLPQTMWYLAIGFVSLAAGFYVPAARGAGEWIGRALPRWHWQPSEVAAPALALLGVGAAMYLVAFRFGLAGFQTTGEAAGTFDAALVIGFSTVILVATVLLWLVVFQTRPLTRGALAIVAVLLLWTFVDTIIAGRRAALGSAIVMAGGAFWLSGRRVRVKHAVTLATAVALMVAIGMAYGTTFRLVKGTEGRVSLGEYVQLAQRAATQTIDRGLAGNATFVSTHLTERIELVTTVAVIVGNYERLQPFEQEFGLANNIVSGFTTALIPRALWPDKPSVLNPREIGQLYFGLRNSFAVTPVGDLVRNFGPLAIPVGMGLLGMALRLLYAALIEGRAPSMWRTTAYLTLLVSVSFETFYSSILPSVVRTAVVVTVCLLLVEASRARFRRSPARIPRPERPQSLPPIPG